MEGNTICHCAHCQLTHAKVQVASGIILLAEISSIFHICLIRRCKVRTASEELRHNILQTVNHDTGKITGCLRLILICPKLLAAHQCSLIYRSMILIPKLFHVWEFSCIFFKEFIPLSLVALACFSQFLVMSVNIIRNIESLLWICPSEILLHLYDILCSKRCAVCRCSTLLARTAITNLGMYCNEGRMLLISLCFFDSLCNGIQVCSILYFDGLEAKCLHTLLNILSESNVSAALYGNIVAVIENN